MDFDCEKLAGDAVLYEVLVSFELLFFWFSFSTCVRSLFSLFDLYGSNRGLLFNFGELVAFCWYLELSNASFASLFELDDVIGLDACDKLAM